MSELLAGGRWQPGKRVALPVRAWRECLGFSLFRCAGLGREGGLEGRCSASRFRCVACRYRKKGNQMNSQSTGKRRRLRPAFGRTESMAINMYITQLDSLRQPPPPRRCTGGRAPHPNRQGPRGTQELGIFFFDHGTSLDAGNARVCLMLLEGFFGVWTGSALDAVREAAAKTG